MSAYNSSENGVGVGGGSNGSSSNGANNGTSSTSHATTDYERGSYWDDDFRPLRDAGKFILDALRQDESSPNADLFVRINSSSTAPTWSDSSRVAITSSSSSSSSSSGGSLDQESNPSHRYFSADGSLRGGGSNNNSSSSSSSKNNDSDNNGINELYRTDVGEAPVVRHSETVPLPSHLRNMMSKVRTQMLMGLFPQAGLAWMALDDTVYLWSFRSTATTYGPDGQPASGSQFLQLTVPGGAGATAVGGAGAAAPATSSSVGNRPIIVSVGLAPPKPGVFRETVEWCLIVTTKDEARIYCIAQRSGVDINNDQITLGGGWVVVGTSFAIPTDFHSFYSVASTASGRVFLGGSDGNLYELDYDLLVKDNQRNGNGGVFCGGAVAGTSSSGISNPSIQRQLEEFYDGSDGLNGTSPCPAVLVESSYSSASAGLKRMFNAALLSSGGGGGEERARKCRKLNHTQSSFFHRILPDIVADGANSIFGSSTMKEGGPINQIVIDEERQLLYTLSSRGWIAVLDMAAKSDKSDDTDASQLTVAAVLDAPSTARHYLESVAQGRTTPMPRPSKNSFGELRFLGDGEAAARGVGGMDKARKILKLAEPSTTRRGDQGDQSILAPVSIQVVPTHESSRITLVATTSGGLRYYLSVLQPRTINSVPVTPQFGTSRNKQPWCPHSRFTLLYIRGPPQITSTKLPLTGDEPDILQNWKVDSACYSAGNFMVAFTPTGPSNTTTITGSTWQNSIDIIMAATPDQAVKDINRMMVSNNGSQQNNTQIRPGGLCELVSFPVPNSLSARNGDTNPARLPGGRVYDIEKTSSGDHVVLGLAMRSKTPTDAELAFGLVPPFIPPKASQKPTTSDSTSTALVPASNSLISSTALAVMFNIIMNRPVRQGLEIRQPSAPSNEHLPSYRVSKRNGSVGFSLSAADMNTQNNSSSGVSRSARLNPWLLTPPAAPLDPMALQHLEAASSTTWFALNPGGVHSFQSVSLLDQLTSIIASAGSHIENSKDLMSFVVKHGAKETCAMCLLLAVRSDTNKEIQKLSMRAALHYADRPQLLRVDPTDTRTQVSSTLKDDPWTPSGYSLKLSNICSATFMVLSRLLRPIWFKPAVVVTEGRVIKQVSKTVTTPAKVELLLDEYALEQIRKPLLAFEKRIMCYLFSRAVSAVPLKRKADPADDCNDNMEIDGAENLLTSSMQHQYDGRFRGPKDFLLSAEEGQRLAMNMEERNLHSLFRLVTRSTQLLSLLAKLRTAHSMPELPEVNWGLLHGIMFSQLVETRAGQERVENLLNELVTASPSSVSQVSAAAFSTADCDGLATALSRECPFYFSPGTRFAYNGFRAAESALKLHPAESRRLALEQQAVDAFVNAAKNWHSAALITGRLLQTADSEKQYVAIAQKAKHFNSPLAKACCLLSQLGSDYALGSLVDICLLTSENFRPTRPKSSSVTTLTVDRVQTQFDWEKNLYHKQLNLSTGSSDSASTSKGAALGTQVTAEDAIDTCQSIIFAYMTQYLNYSPGSDEHRKGIVMVSRCAGSDDKNFLSAFYAHMLNNRQQETLLGIESPDLEHWLLNNEDHSMIHQYYLKQGKYLEAGQMALKVASDDALVMTLDKRIEFLAEAESALDWTLNHSMMIRIKAEQLVEQVNAKLRLAKLQKRVLSEIGSTRFQITDEEMNRLESRLVSADELYNEYSEPYELYEISMMILHASCLNDSGVIQQTWLNLFTQSIVPCATRYEREVFDPLSSFVSTSQLASPVVTLIDAGQVSPYPLFEDANAEWIRQVQDMVIGIGQKIIHHGSEFVFPVAFVTECLEDIRQMYDNCPQSNTKLTPEWTFSILLEVDVPFKRAMDCVFECMERERVSSDFDVATTIGMLELVVQKYERNDNGLSSSSRQIPIAAVADGLRPYIQKIRLGLQQLQSSSVDDHGSVALLGSRLDMVEEKLGVRF